MSIWAFPLITALVAGDIVASESQNGTLKTILTRSRERGRDLRRQGARVVHVHRGRRRSRWASSGVVAASIAWGFNPLTSLSGTKVAPRHGLGLLAASLGVYALADGRDRRVRAHALDGHAQQRRVGGRDADVGAPDAAARRAAGHRADPARTCSATQFDAWHGFLRTPADWAPVVRALWVCALYVGVPLFASRTSSSCAAT